MRNDFLKEIPVVNDFFESLANKKYNTLVLDTTSDFNIMLIASTFIERNEQIIVVAPNIYKAQQLYDSLIEILGVNSVSFFPADEFVTVEMLASSNEFRTSRINTIIDIIEEKRKIIVTHTLGYLRYELPKNKWIKNKLIINRNTVITKNDFVRKLISFGYKREYQVEKPGDVSVRGYIVDIWTYSDENPVRIEFFDDEIEQIRSFNPTTQRTISKINEVKIYPLFELFYDEDEKRDLVNIVKEKVPSSQRVLDEIEKIENNADLDRMHRYIQFLEHVSLSDYFDEKIVFLSNPKRIKDTYESVINDITEWYLTIEGEYSNLQFTFFSDLNLKIAEDHRVIYFQNVLTSDYKYDHVFRIPSNDVIEYHGNIKMFVNDITKAKETVIIQGSKAVYSLLDDEEIKYRRVGKEDDIKKNRINVINESNGLSFRLFGEVFYVSVNKLFHRTKKKKKHFKLKEAIKLKSVDEIKINDYVVHYDYGIGRYLGIKTVELSGIKNDYIHIGYRNDEVLYVPVENVHLIQKYSASEGARPKINSIGGTSWARTKAKVRKKLKDIAGKLIKLYAERKEAKGYPFPKDDEDQFRFEADFEYKETPDQLKAIEEIKGDMERESPMDRLLCGDVGYGKTEVAMRAAFKSVYATKQVAYLCPTTVLSKQHFKTFKSRFSQYGIKVELLNRFVPLRTQNEIVKDVAKGKVDILIGTHRILSKDIVFKDLGLLIVDEEQRFGVEHKERIKEIKVNVDVITLTATPIPRTLQMALMGVKSTSLLETPPENRYPVQTYVLKENDTVVKDAIERELARGGQVFFLYNKVSDIGRVANKVQRLVPEARVTFAHGQMSREELDSTMNDFIDKVYDVLVCTTIIETGIDIPNANTLIITSADRLGLAQLYQIRGRVGRSDKIAYAYLMYNKYDLLSERAEKRLEVIKEFTELGSGFKIAMRDLSIRGAGDVLGAEQSGFIDTVGIDLYMQMLDEEIKLQQGTEVSRPKPVKQSPIKVSKHIPEDYVDDQAIKIEIHKKIKQIKNNRNIEDLINEMKDRYGKIPNHLIDFMHKSLFDKYASMFDIDLIDNNKSEMVIRFSRLMSDNLNGEKLLFAAFEVDRDLTLKYKNNRITVSLNKKSDKKEPLKIFNQFFEKIV
ncbi:transcription-repair coupling factor [Mycoplasmatota bacterium]|nr:transcription-repair coupling factor [Mycoplasmatota bacterium]